MGAQLSWDKVECCLSDLRAATPHLVQDSSDRGQFFRTFADIAGAILDRVTPDRYEQAAGEISAILHDFQLVDDGQD